MIQKSHIWNSFFESIISGIQSFYICPDVPMDIIRVFLNFRFFSRKSQSQQKKTCKKDHTFYNTVLLKKLTHFTNINSLDIENNILPQHNQNLSDFTNFQKTSLLRHFLTPKNYIPEAH